MSLNSLTKHGSEINVTVDYRIAALVPNYLNHQRENIESIIQAMTESDFEAIRVLGHQMKGSGGGYGFDAISVFGRSIELAAEAQATSEIAHLASELSDYLHRVRVEYQ